MTEKQIETAKKALPGFLESMTRQQRRLYEELSCRNMINSCLIYGSARYNFYDPTTGEFGYYAKDYMKQLGKKTVLRLWNEEFEDFSRATVKHDVYTDAEGVTYNSCIWEDKQEQVNNGV